MNGLVRFTLNGFDVNLIAKYKYDQMINTYSYFVEEYKQGRSSFAKHQFEVLGVDVACPAEDSNITGIRALLDSYACVCLCYKELKTFKVRLNEFIKNINELSEFSFGVVGKTNATNATNLWLIGAGFGYQIRFKIINSHSKQKIYWIEKLDEKALCDEYNKAIDSFGADEDLMDHE